MKPAAFEYHRPATVSDAVALLAELGDEGKVLAGGQSLVPLLSMRLANPEHIVDINAIAELGYVRVQGSAVHLGALARHRTVERSTEATAQPLLAQALAFVAHPTIRNRGTTLGSIVHADPSGEMTAVIALLDGSVRIASAAGERVVAAADFFPGPLESAVEPGELAVEAMVPVAPARTGSAFVEVSRRHGDYAVCGVGAVVTLDESGSVASARLGFISVSPTPLVLDVTSVDPQDAIALADLVTGQVTPNGDIHATADYRRHLAGVLAVRAIGDAARRAGCSEVAA
ncbi:MAG: FAD binding domain-containing protein [Jatrophihabitans sp.]